MTQVRVPQLRWVGKVLRAKSSLDFLDFRGGEKSEVMARNLAPFLDTCRGLWEATVGEVGPELRHLLVDAPSAPSKKESVNFLIFDTTKQKQRDLLTSRGDRVHQVSG